MRRQQITKLFAVVALLGSAQGHAESSAPRTLKSGRPACGNVMGKGERRTEDCDVVVAQKPQKPQKPPRPVEGKPATGKPSTKPSPKPATVAAPTPRPAPPKPTAGATPPEPTAPAMLTTARPRVLANGRPACGNVATRAARSTDCTPKSKP